MSKVNTAPIKWAQRSDSLYITIALPGESYEVWGPLLLLLLIAHLWWMWQPLFCVRGRWVWHSPHQTIIFILTTNSHYIVTADVKDESINLENTTLKFKGKSEGREYEVDIEFFKAVDAEGSTYKVLPRSVQMHVMKKKADDDEEEEFWPRLLKDKALEKNQVRIVWC